MDVLNCELPWPPSVNHYWKRQGHRYFKTTKAKDFTQVVRLLCRRNHALTGRLGIEMLCYPPDKRRRDIDNLLKSVLDSLVCANLCVDDEQFDHITLSRRSVVKYGAVRIRVWELTGVE